MRRHSVKQCREEAAECRRLASVAADAKERARWLHLAKLWKQSAAELDRLAEIGAETTNSVKRKRD